MKNVLVTGGTGFIGRVLVDRLTRKIPNGRVIGMGSKTVDLADPKATFHWFEQQSRNVPIDHVFHLAALYKAGDWPVRHPATQFFVNMSLNVNVLEAWSRYCPKARLTSVVSYCMYPSHPEPHVESELWNTEPEDYLFAYALTKKSLLIGQRAYRREHGLESGSVVLPTIYGPGDSFSENSHVMGALIGKFVRSAAVGSPEVEVWGNGLQEREFLFVEDAVDGILRASSGPPSEVLNLGTGQACSIRDVVALIVDASGFKGTVRYNPDRFVGVQKRVLDVRRIEAELGWVAPTSLRDGIAQTVRWYREFLDKNPTPKAGDLRAS